MDHSKDGRRPSPGLDCACKLFVLSVLVLQNSSLVLATTYSRQREGPLYLTTMLVCLGECIKTSVSIVLTLVGYGRSTGRVLHQHFYVEARSLWRMAVPALLYTVSNNLALVAMSNLSAVAYQVANQLKIPATALMSRLLLQRRISRLQWGAILLLVLGVVLVQLRPGSERPPGAARETRPVLGLVAVVANALAGAFAGVWFERMVKARRPDGSAPPLWVSNLQLCLFSLPLAAATVLLDDLPAVRAGGALRGFDGMACLVLLLHAAGGIIVALTVKYSDNVAKTFATSIAILVSCVGTYVLFGSELSPQFFLGLVLVLIATLAYSWPGRDARGGAPAAEGRGGRYSLVPSSEGEDSPR
eukprot:Transcript_119.p1 GENE.Transcript_119~~Transcript_119.p1  ORF type:complete len:392 (-),score=127.95 Transcript_119:100-1176(-)